MFGGSSSTPGVWVDPKDSFWGLTASAAKIPVIKNCSRPGNSFDTVCQLLIGMQSEFDWKNDLFLIGIPPLERITVFDDHKDTEYYGHTIHIENWQKEQFDISCHRGLICLQNYGADQVLVIHHDRAWVETQALRNLFLITQWLDACQANYMLINLSKGLDRNNCWGPSSFVLPYIEKHSRCIVFEDCYQDINVNINQPPDFAKLGWNGHHGPVGNKYFFEKSLLPRLQKCNLV